MGDEDRLLTRLEILDIQLRAYSKNITEEKLQEEIIKLQEDKNEYQNTAKESLRKVLQEKLEATQKVDDLQRGLSNMETECNHLKEVVNIRQGEITTLAVKNEEQLKRMAELTEKLESAEKNHKEACERLEKERSDLEEKLAELK